MTTPIGRPEPFHELDAFGGHAGAGSGLHLGGLVHATARLAHDLVADPRTAHGVAVKDRRTVGSRPPVAPLGQRDERGPEVATLLGQQVLVQHGLLGVSAPPHDPGLDEAIEAVLQDVGRDPEAALEVAVAARTSQEGVSDDEQAPPFAHRFEGARDRAHLGVVGLAEPPPHLGGTRMKKSGGGGSPARGEQPGGSPPPTALPKGRDQNRKDLSPQTPPRWRRRRRGRARLQLLVKEKELTRARDALAAERRRMPWLAVEKEYEFDGPEGKESLPDLFDGRRQLIVYRAFFEPGVFGWPEHACRGCSLVADQVAHVAHLNARDTTLAFVSRAPQADIERVKARMGWEIPWYTLTDSFDADFGVDEWHGTNAFIRDGDSVFRTYFINNRGDEVMGGTWSYLDMTALGRQEEWEDSPQGYPQTPPYEWWNWQPARPAAAHPPPGGGARGGGRAPPPPPRASWGGFREHPGSVQYLPRVP